MYNYLDQDKNVKFREFLKTELSKTMQTKGQLITAHNRSYTV